MTRGMPQTIQIDCPHCQYRLPIPGGPDGGHEGNCPNCGAGFRLYRSSGQSSIWLEWEARKKPVLVLDLDGTIRYPKDGSEFINHPANVAVFDDVRPLLISHREAGWKITVASNQGGVACGHLTPDHARDAAERTAELLEFRFDSMQLALSHPDGSLDEHGFHSLLRKPQIGMLVLIETHLRTTAATVPDWANSLIVGDRPEDREMAQRADVPFEWAWEFFGRPDPRGETTA